VPVCPHAGGVGLCEYVQHLSMFDFIAVAGTMDGRVIEFVDAELEALQKKIAEKLGFRLVDHRMELYGVSLDRQD